jgi:hypothetical protein
MKTLIAASLILAPIATAHAQEAKVYGDGATSCRLWQSSASVRAEDDQWILGYWSAMEQTRRIDPTAGVGNPAYADAILAQVKHNCASTPDATIATAVLGTFRAPSLPGAPSP